jgi:hypothetical protein
VALADVGAQFQLAARRARRTGPCTVASVGCSPGLSASALAPRAWSSATTSIDMPSVSDSRMNSCRFSSHFLPVAVRNWMAAIHSSGVRSTSRAKACACFTSAVITCLKRASWQSAMRSMTACAKSLASSWPWACLLGKVAAAV